MLVARRHQAKIIPFLDLMTKWKKNYKMQFFGVIHAEDTWYCQVSLRFFYIKELTFQMIQQTFFSFVIDGKEHLNFSN